MSSCLAAFVLIPLCVLHCVRIVVHMPLVAVRLSNNKHFVWQCYIHVCVYVWRTNVDSICILRCFVLYVVCRRVSRACAHSGSPSLFKSTRVSVGYDVRRFVVVTADEHMSRM